MTTDTIQTDVSFESPEAAAEEVLKRWGVDEETPSTNAEDDVPEVVTEEVTADEVDLDFQEEETQEDPEKEPDTPPTKRLASDEDEVVVKVDGAEHRASVKDLTRLYGQEASLTRKGQELGTQRKLADEQSMVAMAVLTKMYEKATEKVKPYEGIDLFKASRQLEPEEFDALRSEMVKAHEEKKFFEAELGQFTENLKKQQKEYIRAQAQTAISVLKEKIPNWSDAVYDDIRGYAVKEGLHPDVVNQIVDPNALLMIHKARLYDAAKAKAVAKTTPVTTRVPPKSTRPAALPTRTAQSAKSAMERFQRSGNADDAVEVLLARWSQ